MFIIKKKYFLFIERIKDINLSDICIVSPDINNIKPYLNYIFNNEKLLIVTTKVIRGGMASLLDPFNAEKASLNAMLNTGSMARPPNTIIK